MLWFVWTTLRFVSDFSEMCWRCNIKFCSNEIFGGMLPADRHSERGPPVPYPSPVRPMFIEHSQHNCGHSTRKQGSCLEKEIMQGTMPGARRRGRPRTAWMDNIKTWTGRPVEESIRMTEDRDKWRKYVHGVANPRIEDVQRTEQNPPQYFRRSAAVWIHQWLAQYNAVGGWLSQ